VPLLALVVLLVLAPHSEPHLEFAVPALPVALALLAVLVPLLRPVSGY